MGAVDDLNELDAILASANHREETCTDEHCPLWDTHHHVYVHWSPSLGNWTIEDACPDCNDDL